jgi:hypothetical protein
LSSAESVTASLISDLSEPSYNINVKLPAELLTNSITAYLTITVVTFGDIENFLQNKGEEVEMPDPVILSFSCFNLFSDDDECSTPLNAQEYLENETMPDNRWVRYGNYQIKMY